MSNKRNSNYEGTVLVIEDSHDSINLIRSILEEARFRVLIATSGESAFDRLIINNPDIILLDILLPGMDGYETCKLLKSDERWKRIPVIFLSALTDPYDKKIGFEAGAVDFLNKPYSPEELLARVKTHLASYRLHNQTLVYAKELEERIQDLDAFTYTVSHDLRNPIRAMDGYAHLLSMDLLSGNTERNTYFLDKIYENIIMMDNLIEDLLKFSRMSRKPLEFSHIDMNSLVHSVVREMREVFPGREVDITIDDIPSTVGDSHLIRQVYINLLSNAMKFTKTIQYPKITIGYSSSEKLGGYYVKDNGIGFEDQFAEKIFDVFYKLDKSGTYEGTGVGLAIVKRIIIKHNGLIQAHSKLGSGAAFYFTLEKKVS